MGEGTAIRNPAWPRLLLLATVALGAGLLLQRAAATLPVELWWPALRAPAESDIRQAVFGLAIMPRAAVALLAGAALGLAGALCQHVLRNPLAEPTVLGVSAGAQLALIAATLWLPGALAWGPGVPAFAGAALVALLILSLALRGGVSPGAIVLSGLIIGLYGASLAALAVIFHRDYLTDILLWQAGALDQTGWEVAFYLAPRLAAGFLLAALLIRPLELLGLSDEGAQGLGLRLGLIRTLTFLLAAGLAGAVAATVGVIGFVGLIAPHLARAAGARRLRQRLVWSPLVGGGLLFATDQILQSVPGLGFIPTGAASSILSLPLLLWLMRRLGASGERSLPAAGLPLAPGQRPALILACLLAALAVMAAVALFAGHGEQGWQWLSPADSPFLGWRWPRVLGAISAGALVAVAGLLLQRTTGNMMASPELLGVSQGAALGVTLLAVVAPSADGATALLAAMAGALAALAILAGTALSGRLGRGGADRVLLAGATLGSLFGGLATLLLAMAGARAMALLSWMTGSTAQLTPSLALTAAGCAAAVLLLGLAARRWLAILPLGPETAAGLGLPAGRGRLGLLTLAAAATGVATVLVGPLSFIGLLAPRLVVLAGFRTPVQTMIAAAATGALLLTAADWLGRNLIYPWALPAGLLATVLGCPVALWLLLRRRGPEGVGAR